MAEFCLSCYNEMENTHLTEKDVTLSEDVDLCEGCGERKQVVILPYRVKHKLLRWLRLK